VSGWSLQRFVVIDDWYSSHPPDQFPVAFDKRFTMSNPLLRPNDPRFQKPELRDSDGKNRFGEAANDQDTANAVDEVFAAAVDADARPYLPQYEAQQPSRANLLLILGGFGWAAVVAGGISLVGVFDIGWLSPLLGVFPAGAAWFLAHAEMKAIQTGAIDGRNQSPVLHAFWLGLTSLLACLAIVVAMIYRQMHFLPDL
jgi:hypothetical protein